jgi:ABC-type dipeptide/oligopeptide/nickel transport system permease subunit
MTVSAYDPSQLPTESRHLDRPRGLWLQAFRRLVRQPAAVTAFLTLLALLVAGAFAPQIAPQGWNHLNLSAQWRNHPPILSGWHLLGTDHIGRDVLVRTLYGLHTSDEAALLAALLATVLGVAIGGIAGARGGWLDVILMRVCDLMTAFPALLLLYAAYQFLEPVTIRTATIILTLYLSAPVAKILRPYVVSLKNADFVAAARALGASELRIFLRHLLPNTAGPIVVAATALVGQVIMLEATVEFLGLGVPSEIRPTLGNLLGDAASTGIGSYNQLGLGWWAWATPAIALILLIVCFNVIGDGLDRALTPALGGTGS